MGTNKSNEPSDENESNNILKFISNSGIYTSLSQLSHISIAPTQLMLFSSIPLLGGSYLGYRRQMRLISDSTNPSNMKFALRALSIGSMLSVGGFGIVTASKSTYKLFIPTNTLIFISRYILCNRIIIIK